MHKLNQKNRTEARIVKLESEYKPSIQSFDVKNLKNSDENHYTGIKSKFGALAATDPDRMTRQQKDSRFMMNPLLREPLSIEQEERRVIDERVKQHVEMMTAEIQSKAHSEGYEAGKKAGYEDAYKKFREEGVIRLQQLDECLSQCEKAKEDIFKANERLLVEMIFRIARMLALKEISSDREYLLRLCHELMSQISVGDCVRIQISSVDFKMIQELKGNLEKDFNELKNISVESSDQVKMGGCLLETDWNAIDARLETQISRIYEGLLGGSIQ